MNIELVEVEIMLDQIIKNCLDQMQEFVNGVIFLISFWLYEEELVVFI